MTTQESDRPLVGDPGVLEVAWRVQEEASKMGFDWPDISGVIAKVREETDEIQAALESNDRSHAALELGDLLFVCVNLARFLSIRPEDALKRACDTFTERFDMLKQCLDREGRSIKSCSLEELDEVWNRVKVLTHQHTKKGG